jgi:hypothetical protein
LGCEDERDKVYGLLSIVDTPYKVPDIDYDKSVEQVYLDTIRILLTERQGDGFKEIVHYGVTLSRLMCLSDRNQSALLKLFEDIDMRFGHRVWSLQTMAKSFPLRPPIIDAIGFEPPESPDQWWYEYDGVRYCFPVPFSKQKQFHQALLRALIMGVIFVGSVGLMLLTEELQYVATFISVGLFLSLLQVAAPRLFDPSSYF